MMKKDITNIDPALSHMHDFSKVTYNTAGKLNQMREEVIFNDGAFSAKLKALIAALWGVSTKCEPCFKFYIQKAKKLGITEKELGEILAIASVMGGCVGEMWALKAYKAYKDADTSDNQQCCDD